MALLPVNHLRTKGAAQVLLDGVDRAGKSQNFLVGPPELRLRLVPFFPVNHLRTEGASQVLLEGVDRAGEGIMVSPAHLMCLRSTSDGDRPRR